MPVQDSEAIVLRTFSLGEADRLVSFLSRSIGRLRGVAKGARRPKSRFGSTLELLSYVRIWFYERETRDLVRINQCELIESFLEVQQDYTAGVALAMVSEIAENVLPEREASDAMFRLLLVTARSMKAKEKTALALGYFALWTLRLAGWLPRLDRCANCSAAIGKEDAFAAGVQEGFVCRTCRLGAMRTISPAEQAVANRILGEKLEKLTGAAVPVAAAWSLTNYALDQIEFHIERKLNTRPLLEMKV